MQLTFNYMFMPEINLANIHFLTDFQLNAKVFVGKLKETKEPLILTVNGKAEVIVQDAEMYRNLLKRLEHAETVAGILKSMEEFNRGEGIPVNEAFAKLRKKHSLSD
jgi:PHD/YefM family antitoxin component YafN of YafNO toxin-antitoxin module